jgi:hypothetical protein
MGGVEVGDLIFAVDGAPVWLPEVFMWHIMRPVFCWV